jgi:hypothetical protein
MHYVSEEDLKKLLALVKLEDIGYVFDRLKREWVKI